MFRKTFSILKSAGVATVLFFGFAGTSMALHSSGLPYLYYACKDEGTALEVLKTVTDPEFSGKLEDLPEKSKTECRNLSKDIPITVDNVHKVTPVSPVLEDIAGDRVQVLSLPTSQGVFYVFAANADLIEALRDAEGKPSGARL